MRGPDGNAGRWRGAIGAAMRMVDAMGTHNIGLYSAGIAFFALLAVFPGVAALIAFWGFMSDPALIEGQLDLVREFLPEEAFGLLEGQVERLVSTHDSQLGLATLVSTAATLWSARLGVGGLIHALNAVHGRPNRNGFFHAAVAIGLTLGLIGVAILALATVVVLPVLLAFLPLGGLAFWTLRLGNGVVMLAVVVGGLALVYRYGPNRRPRGRRWFPPGLWLAVGVWAAASIGFAEFLARFGNYGAVYGSLGAVVALLMWFYISAYAVLLGAVMNVVLDPEPGGPGAAAATPAGGRPAASDLGGEAVEQAG